MCLKELKISCYWTLSEMTPGWAFFSDFHAEHSPAQPPIGQVGNQTPDAPKCLVKSDASKISLSLCYNSSFCQIFMNETFVCSRGGRREDRRPRSPSLFGLHLQQRRRSINNLSHHFVDAQPCRNQLKLESARGEKICVCVCVVTGAG